MPRIDLRVDEENTGLRLDVFLSENTPLSRSYIQKLIKEDRILVNGEKTVKKYETRNGDEISVDYDENTLTDLRPKEMSLDIIYEDSDLIVINKQKDLVVHPAPGNYDNTLVNGLLYHCKELSDVNGYYRPGIVHRIDKDTSGLLVCAKNNFTHNALAEQLKDKTCFRRYLAIVSGVVANNEGIIEAPIGRNPKNRQAMTVTDVNAREAITLFKVLERYDDSTLLECDLKTGRTHQIRVHMKFINHPVVNDSKYGKKIIDETGQYLHAYYLSFIHPRTNERVEFTAPVPEYMKEYIKKKGGAYGN